MTKEQNGPATDTKPELESQLVDIQVATLVGDIRDFLLDRLKHDKKPIPWTERGQEEQTWIVQDATDAARLLVTRVTFLVAAEGCSTRIRATLKRLVVKDEVEVSLALPKNADLAPDLFRAQGSDVLLVIIDQDAFEGKQASVPITPDQPQLPLH